MTTIQQQITFVEALRQSFDNNQRESLQCVYPPSVVEELLRDIHENLLAVKHWQVNKRVPLCDTCNQPIVEAELINRCNRCSTVQEFNHFTQL